MAFDITPKTILSLVSFLLVQLREYIDDTEDYINIQVCGVMEISPLGDMILVSRDVPTDSLGPFIACKNGVEKKKKRELN